MTQGGSVGPGLVTEFGILATPFSLASSLLLVFLIAFGAAAQEPEIAPLLLEKSGTLDLGSDGRATPGDVITYTFRIENTSTDPNCGELEYMTIDDTLLGNLVFDIILGAGEVFFLEGSYSITQSDIDAGSVYNQVTADGLPFSPSAVCVETEATAEHTLEIPQGPNEAPVALCSDVTVVAGLDCTAEAFIDAGSYDPNGDEITLPQEPPGPYGLGVTPVTLTVSDGSLQDTCQATVTVVDEAAPFASCNAPPAISPWEVPVSFTATGTDNCGLRRVLVRKPQCHRDWDNDHSQVYSQDLCHVVTQDDTMTILNPARSTQIRWLARAKDTSGNSITRQCRVDVESGLPPVGRQ